MGYAVKVLADSVSPDGVRLTTLEATFPRIILAEVNTHRMLTRNSASSRAIPVAKRIAAIEADPFVPESFGKNQKGMQAGVELGAEDSDRARGFWLDALERALAFGRALAGLEVHKQIANRLLEPFAWHTAVITATEWDNHEALRCHPAAQPEYQRTAFMMRDARAASVPRQVDYDGWHLPYLEDGEELALLREGFSPVKVSIGRCARTSHLTQDGKRSPAEDVGLYDRLASAGHMSPLEHAARPARRIDDFGTVSLETVLSFYKRGLSPYDVPVAMRWFGNFRGWVQHRKEIAGEAVFGG